MIRCAENKPVLLWADIYSKYWRAGGFMMDLIRFY